MEGHIDALEGDGGEAALQLDGLGFRRGLGGAFADDFDESGLDVFQGEGFDEGVDVDFLGFEEVGDVCEAVESTELEMNVISVRLSPGGQV